MMLSKGLLLGSILISFAAGSMADSTIGVISWNVKGNTSVANGGWSVPATQSREILSIKNKINASQVDFINLVQTTEQGINNKTHLDQVLGTSRWSGVYSDCHFDATQIIYDNTKWQKIGSDFSGGFTDQCTGVDDRPYSMALFKSKQSANNKPVLFISVHFPHIGRYSWEGTAANLANSGFTNGFNTILKQNNLTADKVRVIMAGDMNEIGENFYGYQGIINTLKTGITAINDALSAQVKSCCSSNGYNSHFDKVYSTNSMIKQAPQDVLFDMTDYNIDEQHRPIYVLVSPLPGNEEQDFSQYYY
ncbi:MAG: hypothetical protein K0R94_39 [Burkholderiales bacterium]|nr:hypothetical protein [Burkholderiales bacterium]